MSEKIRDTFRQVGITYYLEGITDEAMCPMVDIYLTSERISFVFAEKRFMPPILGGLITSIPAALIQRYQTRSSDRDIDIEMLDDLANNGLSFYAPYSEVSCKANDIKKSAVDTLLWMDSKSRITIDGTFRINKSSVKGYVYFKYEDKAKTAKKELERHSPILVRLDSQKIED